MKRPVKKAARKLGDSAARPLGRPKPASRGARYAPAQQRFPIILAHLKNAYPDAHCELDFTDPFQLICATILSAQCTDVRVNMVTPALFAKFPDAAALAAAKQEDVEEIIRCTGFFRNKAKSLIGMAQAVVAEHGGKIPSTMDALVKLPGVGRKTANVVLGNAFGMNEGVVVDTHVGRLSALLGLTRESDPIKVEQTLMMLTPRDDWALLSHLLIFHGRRICIARRPRCWECVVAEWCPGRREDGQMDSQTDGQ
jgi:endonuclease-3